MASASIFARSDRKSGKGLPLYLRLTHKGDRARLSLDIKVQEKHWNADKKTVRGSHSQAEFLNDYLSQVQSTADGAIARCKAEGWTPGADRLKEMVDTELNGSDEADVLNFFRDRLQGYRRREQIGTYQNYRAVLDKFEQFWETEGVGSLTPQDLSVSLVEDWRTWLYEVKGNNKTTVSKALSVLRTFYRKAQKEGVIPRDEYIFDHITIERGNREKDLPSAAELEKLIGLWEEWKGDLSAVVSTSRWQSLAYFLAAYYMGGMRFQDVAHLTWDHLKGWPGPNARVKYKMGKTEDVTALPVVPALREILELFDDRREKHERVFPIFDDRDVSTPEEELRSRNRANSLVNKHLRKISKQLEITRVTMHMARNLSAWRYYQATNDIYQVKKMMGHESVDQTRDYLRGFGDDIDDSFRNAFG